MSEKFHDKAKDAGNKLKGNILSFSSVATGVFFFTLTGKDVSEFSPLEKGLLLIAISFFALTVLICLFELYIDSQRFFAIAKQMAKQESEQDWERPIRLKRVRRILINSSYLTVSLGFLVTFIYMVQRVA